MYISEECPISNNFLNHMYTITLSLQVYFFHLISAYTLPQANMHVSAHVSAQILGMEQILGLSDFCPL